MTNYESLLVETPEVWEDYMPGFDEDEEADLCAETELNFEE